MKRINKKSKIKRIRLYKYRERKKNKIFRIRNLSKKIKKHNLKTTIIEAPEFFALQEEGRIRTVFLRFLKKIKESIKQNQKVKISFHKTKKLYPCGTILFLAEIRNIIDNPHFKNRIKWSAPKDKIVHQLFKHVGFFEWFNKKTSLEITHESVTRWGFYQGNKVEEIGNAPGLKELSDKKTIPIELFTGIKEAIINTGQHAYDPKFFKRENINKKWSMFYSYDEKTKNFSLAICDLGIGILQSFKQEKYAQNLIEKIIVNTFANIKPNRHAAAIQAAVQYGASRTKEENRGKGFKDMKSAVETSSSGWLKIMSHLGGYHYEPSPNLNEAKGQDKLINYKENSFSTIILWNFNLSTNEE